MTCNPKLTLDNPTQTPHSGCLKLSCSGSIVYSLSRLLAHVPDMKKVQGSSPRGTTCIEHTVYIINLIDHRAAVDSLKINQDKYRQQNTKNNNKMLY